MKKSVRNEFRADLVSLLEKHGIEKTIASTDPEGETTMWADALAAYLCHCLDAIDIANHRQGWLTLMAEAHSTPVEMEAK